MWGVPKVPFSKLRQKADLVVMKLKIWIKWFIISLIYIQDISQKFPVLKMFSIWRIDSTRMDFHSPLPLTYHTLLSFPNKVLPPIRLSQDTMKDVSFKWGLSSWFHLSSEPCDEGAEPPGGWCDGRETDLLPLPWYPGPSLMIMWAQEGEFGE